MALIEPVEFVSKKSQKILIRCLEEKEALALKEAMTEIAETSPYILSSAESFRKMTEEEEKKFINFHNNRDDALLIGAFHNNKIIGLYNFFAYKDEKRKHRGALGISLHIQFQNQGIAKKLFQVSLEKIKQMPSIRFVELDVMDVNEPAIQLYKTVGFKEVYRAPEAFKLDDGRFVGDIRMRLEIKK